MSSACFFFYKVLSPKHLLRNTVELPLMATSPQRPLFWRTVHTFTLVSTSPQWPPLYNGHLSTTATSPQRPLPHNGHLSSTVTFPQWPLLHYGHLSTTAIFFGRQSIRSLLFQPLYNGHFLLSPRWPLQRGSTVI